jgi:heavy metal sensor kinase
MRRVLRYFRHIRIRLTLWYIFLLAVVLILFGGTLYFSLKTSLLNDVDASLRQTSSQIVVSMEVEDSVLSIQNTDEPVNLLTELASQGYAVRISDPEGATLQGAGLYKDIFGNGNISGEGFETVEVFGSKWRVYTIGVKMQGSWNVTFIQVGESLSKVESTLSKMLFIELISIPVVLLLALAVGIFMAGRALRPIEKITSLAAATQAVDLSRRLDLDLPEDEIGRLASTFNGMLDRLEETFSSQRIFVSEAAHELRTPLTIIKGTTEVALSRERTTQEYRDVLGELETEIDHLAELAEDLLTLSRADSESAVLNMQEIDLFEVARSVVDLIAPLAEQKKITIGLKAAGPIPFKGDASKLTRMFLNILDNAMKYSSRNSKVFMSMYPTSEGIVAEVRDMGPGIRSGEIDRIFDRFHRSEEARDIYPSGSGLGLPIARWVARAHGGDIFVESESGKGTIFRIVLPVAPHQ